MVKTIRSYAHPFERLLTRIQLNSNGCWDWLGYKNKRIRYGQLTYDKKNHSVHVVSYELFKGKKPVNTHIDHLCRNRSCLNPDHLECVTPRENILRGDGLASINSKKTHCLKGHEYSGENLFFYRKNSRGCRQCRILMERIRNVKRFKK